MKVELKADVTKTGKERMTAQITDFSGTNMTPQQHAEVALAIALSLIGSVRGTALKETPAGRHARAALERAGLDSAPEEAAEEQETEAGEEEEQAAPRKGARSRG